MAWDELELVRVHGEFLTLSGGELWERVELVAWQKRERERAESTAKQREFRSRQHGRLYHRDYERQRRVRNKRTPAVVRCCAICRRMYTVSKSQYEDGTRFCSQRCAGRYRIRRHQPRPTRMVTINGRTRSLPEWAQHFGITVSMVYRRLRGGMPIVEALTKPKNPGGRRRCLTEEDATHAVSSRDQE